ncbi:PHP-associated domain-containing protein, partial [Fibrobacter sp.]|uniref:PHP domain-containing protein n=1 Tax=Fibrobacter sp. TaxID=35828 RepID=UPI0025BB20B6
GCVVQAHPFRERDYIRHVRLGLSYCDGIEGANAANTQHADAAAYRYAKQYGLPMTAGSDNHHSTPKVDVNRQIMGLALDKRLENIHDLVHLTKNRAPIGLHVPAGRWNVAPDAPYIDAFFLNEDEQLTPSGKDWLRDA